MIKVVLNIYSWIFARKIFSKLNLALFYLSLKGLGVFNYENSTVNGELFFLKKVLPKAIKNKQPVFIDVGANIGNFSLSLANRYEDATIYSFEPHPTNFETLRKRTSGSKIEPYCVALGEKAGESILYDRADRDGSSLASLYEEVISEIHKEDTTSINISIDTLDNFVQRKNLQYIDFVKIDTEGNELSVLKGAKELIKNSKIGCIHFEFNEMNIISRVFMRDFRSILNNYDLFRLLPNGLLKLNDTPLITELFAYQNIVALPKTK